MSDKVLRCNSCGFTLEASSGSQNRIKCPKCGAVNVIAAPENSGSDAGAEVVKGLPVTEQWSDVHRGVVSWILNNHEVMPPDILQELKITDAKRLIVPCYLYDCSVTIRYAKQVNVNNESLTVNNQQNDPYAFSVKIIRSCSSQYQDAIAALYDGATLVNLVDVEQLRYPSDAAEVPVDIPDASSKANVEQTLINLAREQLPALVKTGNYVEQFGDNRNFTVHFTYPSQRINLPLTRVSYEYKNLTGELFISGDIQKVHAVNFPVNLDYKNQVEKHNKKKRYGCDGCVSIVIGTIPFIMGFSLLSDQGLPFFIPLIIIVSGMFLIGLGSYFIYNAVINTNRINAEIDKLTLEQVRAMVQFVKKRVPLRGVWERSLAGKPEAFPDNLIRTQLNIPSAGAKKSEVIRIVSQSANLSLQQAEALVKNGPFVIYPATDAEADSIQKELESVGATVTRAYILPNKANNS